MSLELKKQILKITSIVFMTLILFTSSSKTTLALGELVKDGVYDGCTLSSMWNCAETSTSVPMQKNCPNVNSGLYVEARVKTPVDCIRNGGCTNWGKVCAVDCPNPAACGACECRCYADGGLKCEDRWRQDGIERAQSCTIPTGVLVNSLPSNGKNEKCVPTANITAPANNSTFATGAAISFKATTSDPVGEAFTAYNWVIRTKTNNAARIFTADIYGTTKDFTISTLPAGSYYAFFSAKNAINETAKPFGIWSDWRRIGFTVTNPVYSCTGTIPAYNGAWDAEESQSLIASRAWALSATDTTTKCQYHPYSCTGIVPNNATMFINDNVNLTGNTAYTYWASDTGARCQYTCNLNFHWDGGACVANPPPVCADPLCSVDAANYCNGSIYRTSCSTPCVGTKPGTCDDSISDTICTGSTYSDSCDGVCPGTKSCINSNWREVNPN